MSNEKNTASRRRFLLNIGVITTGLLLDSKHILAQAESPVITIRNEAAKSPIKVTPLRGNIHVLEGSGGNIAVFAGPDGKLMVDAGIAVSQQKILTEMNKISAGPLKYLINSHWHFDHADGNKWVHDAGATIIAHEKTRENLSKTIRVEDWNYTFPGTSGGALPTVVFQQEHVLKFNGSENQTCICRRMTC